MHVFSLCLFVFFIKLCHGYTFIDRSDYDFINYGATSKHGVDIFPFETIPYQVDFNEEEVLCFIILKAPLTTDSILMQGLHEPYGHVSFTPIPWTEAPEESLPNWAVEQFGFGLIDINTTSSLLRSSDLDRYHYSSWDFADDDGVKITCYKGNRADALEIISIQLLIDEYENGKTSIKIEDTINLTEGERMQLYCTGTGTLYNDLRQPLMILDTKNTSEMVAENITMEHSGTLVRGNEFHPQDINKTPRFMIIVYRSQLGHMN